MKILHFIGIGGIGMSGLATLLLEKGGYQVSGSDVKTTDIIEKLQMKGATIYSSHAREHVPPAATVVVSTDIPQDNPELLEAKRLNLPIIHRSDLLVELMKGQKVLAVTGTHGKTTSTALLAYTLYQAACDPTIAVGGIMVNLGINARFGKGDYFVAEADESDGTFLKYPYTGAIVTNIDTDHIAHFQSTEKLEEAFSLFISKAPNTSHLFYCIDNDRLRRLHPKGTSYGFSIDADLVIESASLLPNKTLFSIRFQGKEYKDIEIKLLGRHNVLNASAVFGLLLSLGLPEETIRKHFATFSSTKRRLEVRLQNEHFSIYDDYAHHPTEIKATLSSLRQTIMKRPLIAVFQPHRPSRMNICMHELHGAFQDADAIVVTDLYKSGEKDLPGCTDETIFQKVQEGNPGKPCHFFQKNELVAKLYKMMKKDDVVVFLGAGDITKLSNELTSSLGKDCV